MASGSQRAVDGFERFISNLHADARSSFQFRVFETPNDHPESVEVGPGDSAEKAERERLDVLNAASLQKHSGVNAQIYCSILEHAGLLFKYGSGWRVKPEKWRSLFSRLDMEDSEIDSADPSGRDGKRWYIRLEPKQDGYCLSVNDSNFFSPPRTNSISEDRRRLRGAV